MRHLSLRQPVPRLLGLLLPVALAAGALLARPATAQKSGTFIPTAPGQGAQEEPGASGLVLGAGAEDEDEPTDDAETGEDADADEAADEESSAADDGAGGSGSGGTFELGFEPTSVAEWRGLAGKLSGSARLKAVIEDVNAYVDLPRPIPVVFRDCEEENAWYDGDAEEITLCWNLVASYQQVFLANEESRSDAEAKALAATAFTVYHEIGHALIGQLEVPVTGREEDAVDELAALVLINAAEDDEGEQMAYDGAEAFYLVAAESAELTEEDYADVHSLDLQRYYNILCLIYGSDTSGYAHLVDEGDLPEIRAGTCESEFAQKTDSWTRLLGSNLVALP